MPERLVTGLHLCCTAEDALESLEWCPLVHVALLGPRASWLQACWCAALQRMPLAGIKQHPWFLEDLPDGALAMNDVFLMDHMKPKLEHVSAPPWVGSAPLPVRQAPSLLVCTGQSCV